MTTYPTRQARNSELSDEDKILLGGFETLTLFNPNLSDLAKELFIENTETSMKSADGKLLQYDNGDGVIADFFNNESLLAQITDDDIKILKLLDDHYQNFEIRMA